MALLMVDAAARLTQERAEMVRTMLTVANEHQVSAWLLLNKIDLVKPRWRAAKREEYAAAAAEGGHSFDRVLVISAREGHGMDGLREALLKEATPGPWCALGPCPPPPSSPLTPVACVAPLNHPSQGGS